MSGALTRALHPCHLRQDGQVSITASSTCNSKHVATTPVSDRRPRACIGSDNSGRYCSAVAKRTIAILSLALGLVLGGAAGFLWHAPGRASTWNDVRAWLTFAVIVLGFAVAAYELNLQRRQFAEHFSRQAARDDLLDGQLRELADRQRSKEREQAECIDLTWNDLDSEPGNSLVVVINESRRPIRSVICAVYPESSDRTLAPCSCAEMYPPTPDRPGWMFPNSTNSDSPAMIYALRAGGRAGFKFLRARRQLLEAEIQFSDDAGLRWVLNNELHLKQL